MDAKNHQNERMFPPATAVPIHGLHSGRSHVVRRRLYFLRAHGGYTGALCPPEVVVVVDQRLRLRVPFHTPARLHAEVALRVV
jgi:hypothetical protein